jgi:TetR/AcrR family transcriptional regulator, transcriptional repressor for nem operon
MKVSRVVQADHRAALLEQASRLFRREGIGAVGIADIARAAGLTHGAFYGHFPSKAALAAEAGATALRDAAARWRQRAARAEAEGRDPLAALVDHYLSEAHRDAPETGCALASVGPETAREAQLRRAIGGGVVALADALEEVIADARPATPAPRRQAVALAMLAAMNGGLILARTLADRPDLSRAALAAARDAAMRAAD